MSARITLPIGASVTPCTAAMWNGESCREREPGFYLHSCWRPAGHGGRHAFITSDGVVGSVWGEDVHAEKRAKGRAS